VHASKVIPCVVSHVSCVSGFPMHGYKIRIDLSASHSLRLLVRFTTLSNKWKM
jgi:hypothetical protein